MLPSGAPGSVLLYSITAIMFLPRPSHTTNARGTQSATHDGLPRPRNGDRVGRSKVWSCTPAGKSSRDARFLSLREGPDAKGLVPSIGGWLSEVGVENSRQ